MKKNLLLFTFMVMGLLQVQAQKITISEARFHVGDQAAWNRMNFDDSQWTIVPVGELWTNFGVSNPNNYAWYRMKVVIPKSLVENAFDKSLVKIGVAKVDDCDETFVNGVLVGKTGSMPQDAGGYKMAYDEVRSYVVDGKLIKWDQENTIAVRVYNGNDPGGIFDGQVTVEPVMLADAVDIKFAEKEANGENVCDITLDSKVGYKGQMKVSVVDLENNQELYTRSLNVTKKAKTMSLPYDLHKQLRLKVTYTDAKTGAQATECYSPKYILTPAAPATPRYNGPQVYGVRTGSPVILRMAFSGEKPMKYSIKGMPEGLSVDARTGVISGAVKKAGNYKLTFVAENAKGKTEQAFTLRVGEKIALTPPMGWNSWNCWGLSVSQEKVISSAQAILDKGLADYGYSYINVDDAWEAKERNADGTIATNEKFPDMKGLGDWLHANGLKFGIYSSPGDYTCGRYLGSIDHEEQDAKTYNEWGVDYLKYDWCGYGREYEKLGDHSVAAFARPYMKMQQYLRQQPRDIFYSLCQYGMAQVWTWGHAVDANSWRTTGDITDTWESLYDIGFCQQVGLEPYAAPGHWNDPDMLIVGKVGWSNNLRDTRLTPDEQYTHISLWALLASNMLIGCDVAQMDDFTVALLCNHEVNAVNQDVLGKQARQAVVDGDLQIWIRPLADGTYAVGLFNIGKEDLTTDLASYRAALGLNAPIKGLRDLWRQKDLNTTEFLIPSHGVKLLKIKL